MAVPRNEHHKTTWNLLLEGDPQSLDRLYQEHYLGLFNYGIWYCGRRELVKDSITQMILDLWNIRRKLPEVSNVRAYLITTLRRKLIREMKSEKRVELREPAGENFGSMTEASYEEYITNLQNDDRLRNKIHAALKNLSDRQKELLRLRFFEDKTYDEIAGQCGITKRTAYNIIYDALSQLRSSLTNDEESSKYYSFSADAILLFLFSTGILEKL